MKQLLLASVFAIASTSAFAWDDWAKPTETMCSERGLEKADFDKCMRVWVGLPEPDARAEEPIEPPARVTVAPPALPPGMPPPIGWVYQPFVACDWLGIQCVVRVPADGLNVRTVPNGPAIMSLVNGVPLFPVQRVGNWMLVSVGCDLTPTFAWSWTAGVPINRCWVYF